MVERLERLEREATAAPWEVMFGHLCTHPGIEAPTVRFSVVVYGSPDDPTDEVGVQKMEDAALIVAMRNDLPTLLSQLREREERVQELEDLLLDMASYIGSDVFIRASNAHDMNVKCAQLTTELAAAERTVREQREALETIAERPCVLIFNPVYPTCEALMAKSDAWSLCPTCIARQALAALAPDTEPERTPDQIMVHDDTGEWHDLGCPYLTEYGQVSPRVCTCPAIVGVAPNTEGEGT